MSEDVLERAKIIAEKMGDRRIYYAGCWTLAEDLGYSKTGENTEFKEVAHPEDFIWCEVLPGINLLPELIAEVERLRSHHIQIMGKIRAWILNDCAEVCRGFDWRDEEISRQREEIDAKDARIKELEEANRNIDKRRDEMAAFIERLEAAFLKARQCPTCKGEGTIHPIGQPIDSICPKCLGDPESMAREALERIKAETGSGDHVAGANKLILTAEQREEEGKRNA